MTLCAQKVDFTRRKVDLPRKKLDITRKNIPYDTDGLPYTDTITIMMLPILLVTHKVRKLLFK